MYYPQNSITSHIVLYILYLRTVENEEKWDKT